MHISHTTSPAIGCIILASGLGSRFGSNKLLAPLNGKPLLEYILAATHTPLLESRIVVTRHPSVELLCSSRGIPVVCHNEPNRNDTVRIGMEHIRNLSQLQGLLFCTADQPLLSRHTIETMLTTFRQEPDYIYRLSYGEQVGNPVLFPSTFFPDLRTLPMKKGGSYIIKKHPAQVRKIPAQSAHELFDVDTPQDLLLVESLLKS